MVESSSRRPRRRAKRGEGAKLRAEILDATNALLLDAGSEQAVSIQAIADAVGCTPPSIYMHFPDKDALMLEVCARHFQDFADSLEAVDPTEGAPLETLKARGRAYVEFGLANPEVYRILFMQRAGESAAGGVAARATTRENFRPLTEAVERCIEAGDLPDADPFTIACALWASIHGLTALMISNPDFPWPPLDDLLDVGWAASLGSSSAGAG